MSAKLLLVVLLSGAATAHAAPPEWRLVTGTPAMMDADTFALPPRPEVFSTLLALPAGRFAPELERPLVAAFGPPTNISPKYSLRGWQFSDYFVWLKQEAAEVALSVTTEAAPKSPVLDSARLPFGDLLGLVDLSCEEIVVRLGRPTKVFVRTADQLRVDWTLVARGLEVTLWLSCARGDKYLSASWQGLAEPLVAGPSRPSVPWSTDGFVPARIDLGPPRARPPAPADLWPEGWEPGLDMAALVARWGPPVRVYPYQFAHWPGNVQVEFDRAGRLVEVRISDIAHAALAQIPGRRPQAPASQFIGLPLETVFARLGPSGADDELVWTWLRGDEALRVRVVGNPVDAVTYKYIAAPAPPASWSPGCVAAREAAARIARTAPSKTRSAGDVPVFPFGLGTDARLADVIAVLGSPESCSDARATSPGLDLAFSDGRLVRVALDERSLERLWSRAPDDPVFALLAWLVVGPSATDRARALWGTPTLTPTGETRAGKPVVQSHWRVASEVGKVAIVALVSGDRIHAITFTLEQSLVLP